MVGLTLDSGVIDEGSVKMLLSRLGLACVVAAMALGGDASTPPIPADYQSKI